MSEDATIKQEAQAVVLLNRLLNPGDLGHWVSPEVRDLARVALGMRPVESHVDFLARRTAAMTEWFDAFCVDRAGCVFGSDAVAEWIVQLLTGQPYKAGPGFDEHAVQSSELVQQLQKELQIVRGMVADVVALQDAMKLLRGAGTYSEICQRIFDDVLGRRAATAGVA